jgi:hypothetical protein
MTRSRKKSSLVRLPPPVVQWLGAMSTRIGVPRYRVLGALLDRYSDQLPEPLRRRLDDEISRDGERRRPQ